MAAPNIYPLYLEAWKINRSNPLKSIEIANSILQMADESSDEEAKGLGFKILSVANIWISKNDLALQFAYQAIDIFEKLGLKKHIADVYYNLGANYSYVSDFKNALKSYYKCYDLNKELNDEIGMADGLNGIGTIYYRTNENEKALDTLHESKQLCEKHNNKDIYIKVLDGLGEACFNLKDYSNARIYYEKSASISKEIGNKQVESFALDGLARTYSELDNLNLAEKYFHESLQIRRAIGFKMGECFSLIHYATHLRKIKKFTEAIQSIENALDIAKNINFREIIYLSYLELAAIHESKNEFEKAYNWFKKYIEEKEKVQIERSEKIVRSMEIQQNLLRSENEKKLLETKARELEIFNQNLTLIEEIGKKIMSSLSADVIVKTVYEEVNKLMDAEGFGIGVFDKAKEAIVFPLYIEGNEIYKDVVYYLNDIRPACVCFKEKKEIILNHVESEIHQYVPNFKTPKVGKHVESLIYLPLVLNKKTLGVITVQSFKRNAYQFLHVNLLKNIAAYTAIAIENAGLYGKMEEIVEQRTRELKLSKQELELNLQHTKLTSELGKKISSSLDIGEIFNELHNSVSSMMPAECFGIRLLDEKKGVVVYRFEVENGKRDAEFIEVSLEDDDNYTVWCIKNNKEIFINDNLNEYSRYVSKIRVVAGEMPHSLLFVPMSVNQKVIGAVTVQSFSKNAYSQRHLDILRSLASFTAVALDKANVYKNLEMLVDERTQEVKKQKSIIEQKNKDMLDSIRYARRIQQAVCIDPEGFKKLFPDSFIYFRPKDIVSGDFYWFKEVNDWLLFAVADCTGHGVPGAFMSLICSELLNRVSTYHNVHKTSDCLNEIDRELKLMMNRSQEHSAHDGMDISLCAINKKTRMLQYSGAHRPLLHFRDGVLTEFKGNTRSIGGNLSENQTVPFTLHEHLLQPGDVLILTTDGYADQFGGENGKKLKFKNFKNLIQKHHNRPMKLLEKVIDVEFEVWKGNLEQVDDICIMGIRI